MDFVIIVVRGFVIIDDVRYIVCGEFVIIVMFLGYEGDLFLVIIVFGVDLNLIVI